MPPEKKAGVERHVILGVKILLLLRPFYFGSRQDTPIERSVTREEESMKNGLILLGVLLWAGLVQAGELDPGLAVRLSGLGPNEELSVLVHLKAQADLALFHPDNKAGMVAELHRIAEVTQPAILSRYARKIQDVGRFWIYNGFVCTARRDVIRDFAAQPEVDFVEENGTVRLADYEKAPAINTIEWNLTKVRADSVWRQRGYTGQGVVLGIIDTGVDVTHPVFGNRWRQQDGWYDAINGQTSPYDDNGHGTFAMGIAVGAGGLDTIGVAIGATFIAAKGLSAGGGGTFAQLDSCLQWYAYLEGIERGAAAVINAWGGARSETHFWQGCRNLQLLGTSLAFSVGSAGPGPGTVAAPGNYSCLFGLGATDIADAIGSFSARGPAPDSLPWDSSAAWLDPQWGTRIPNHHIKPDLVAPGVNVRSSYNSHGFATMSGTSWGPPHLAGAIALLKEKNPILTTAQLWQIITSTCDTFSWGNPYPNQNYGWGRLNCLRAVDATPSGVESEQTPGSVTGGRRISIVPNPMREEACLISAPWTADEERWSIYDATGRLVKTGTFDHGRTFWGGRDQSGRNLRNGVYFLRTKGRAGAKTAKIVLLR
jgi:subtilisin family serine protease